MQDLSGIEETIEEYLRRHPDVARALEVFKMTEAEYRRTLSEPRTVTTNTTNS